MSKTITVPVDGIGAFAFRRRTLADEIRIQARWEALTGGVEAPSRYLDTLATAVATYETLAIAWPSEQWAPSAITALDMLAGPVDDLLRIHGAFSAREDTFRPPAKRVLQAPSPSPGAQSGDVVSAEIQPPAD